ncbi:MAG: polysaccharide lyase family 7 protein, partial [Acidobacteriota bacterium]
MTLRHKSLLAILVTTAFLTGCGHLTTATTATPAATHLRGSVHGGQQPVATSTIQLWQVDTTGAGAKSMLTTTVLTDASGSFSITNDFTCPSPTTQVYITATGGNPGLSSGTNNGALELIAAIGNCSALTATTFLNINEVTTVAAVWSLQQFIGVSFGTPFANDIGVSSSLAQSTLGMTNAFATAQNLASIATGTATPANASATIEAAKINTFANILATCINSDGSTPCANLFSAVTPSGSAPAADTLQAALYMALNPTNNIATIYALQTANAPFQPSLPSAPFDFTLAIMYTGSGLNVPYLDAVDASGNIWITNAAGGTANGLVELTPNGTPATGSPFLTGSGTPISGPQTVAVDTLGNIWVANHGSGANDLIAFSPTTKTYSTHTAASGCLPQALALDASNDALFPCSGITDLFAFNNTGTPTTPSYSATATTYGAVGNTPEGIAIDALSNVWVANNTSASVTQFDAGALSSAANTFTVGSGPYGIAIDHANNAWVASSSTNSLTQLAYNSLDNYTTNTFTGGGLNSPRYVAIDGNGNIWIANSSPTTLNGTTYISASEFSNNGVPLSPASSPTSPGGFAHATSATTPYPRGIAIDPSGNVWLTGCGLSTSCTSGSSFIFELVGAAAPVVTPLSSAIAQNQLGCCSFTPPLLGGTSPTPTAGYISLQASTYNPVQNYGSFAFEVTRSSGSTGSTAVNYSITDGANATSSDIKPTTGSLTWASGDTSIRTITVPFLTKTDYTGTKTFNVALTPSANGNGAVLSPISSEVVNITDNLPPPSTNAAFALSQWKLGLPVDIYGGSGGVGSIQFEAAEVSPSTLTNGYSSPYFYLNASNSIVFTAPSNGATTTPGSGSDDTRSELREQYTGSGADSNHDWNSTIGGTLTGACTINAVSANTDEATFAQIHGQDSVFVLLIYRPAHNDIEVQLAPTP